MTQPPDTEDPTSRISSRFRKISQLVTERHHPLHTSIQQKGEVYAAISEEKGIIGHAANPISKHGRRLILQNQR